MAGLLFVLLVFILTILLLLYALAKAEAEYKERIKCREKNKTTLSKFSKENRDSSSFSRHLPLEETDTTSAISFKSSYSRPSLEDLLSSLKRKIIEAVCRPQIYLDGGFVQSMKVDENLIVSAQFERDPDIPFQDVWLILLTIDSIDYSTPITNAGYEDLRKYLEEFIICTKACLRGYEKIHGKEPMAWRVASMDNWIAYNYANVFNSIQQEWNVTCDRVHQEGSELIYIKFKD
ncbi:hypothetical protein [Synechococcus sp. BDU 130192]|uniref:hypothetical protein n=1 Tax=Synechococcus sp. BDU 130192 TaxID=2042059 RepID=UPI000C077FC9|nr:hypothetical protein [Synechococcus sp. BDU 130192]